MGLARTRQGRKKFRFATLWDGLDTREAGTFRISHLALGRISSAVQ